MPEVQEVQEVQNDDGKICNRCHRMKPYGEYYPLVAGSPRLKSICKVCNAEKVREYRDQPRGRFLQNLSNQRSRIRKQFGAA